jgi:hypothetical protein
MAGAFTAQAQTTDTTKVKPPVVRPDTTKRRGPLRTAPTVTRQRIAAPRNPPLSPRRAFIYSALLPGLGQSHLDRGTAGAFFAAIELGALAMVFKTSSDLREARRFSGDTLPGNYSVDATGKLTPVLTYGNRFPVELLSARRLHKEDWFAALAFNHLISGADAFVGAQLWDVPKSLSVIPTPNGPALVATLHW